MMMIVETVRGGRAIVAAIGGTQPELVTTNRVNCCTYLPAKQPFSSVRVLSHRALVAHYSDYRWKERVFLRSLLQRSSHSSRTGGGQMDEFTFTENSREMFDAVCQATPWFVRHFTRSGLIKGLKERGCGEVTESILYEVCRDVTPPQHLDKTIAILDALKTTTAT